MVISAELGENFCWIALAYSLALATQPTAASGPLAVKIEQGLGPGNIFQLKELREKILRSNPTDEEWGNRNFGLGGVGHETLYLHRHLDDAMPHLRQRLLDLAIRADEIAGWNATSGAELAARCLELIRYEGSPMDKKKAASIGWHNDGATLVTLVAMLSNADEYEGGALEFRNGAITEQYVLAVGDVLAWRGWTAHRVLPVTRGLRDVFVIEWWLDEDCTTSLLRRASDSLDGLRNALRVDPNSPNLHRWMGKALCEKLPCSDSESAATAEAEFRKAVELAPNDATSMRSLGRFLQGRMSHVGISKRAEGMHYLSAASELDRANSNIFSEDEPDLGTLVGQLSRLLLLVPILAILGLGILYLERLQTSMSAKSSEQELKGRNPTTAKDKKSK
mmetsp:Transcript_87568/g.194698  ORF Transcript_87568/g.194698 Transcript_87568/m.194698 type:complete len:393 (-) Transcript_87568:46-1224(-)